MWVIQNMNKYKLVENEISDKPREYLIQKAMKMKALLSSDEEGEREAARALLSSYMTKYAITWEELDDEIEKEYIVEFNGQYHVLLLIQLVYKQLGSGHCYSVYKAESEEPLELMKVRSKPSTFVEIQLDWEFYWRKFNEELDLFYRAFVEKNHLFPPEELQQEDDEDDNQDLSEDQLRKIQGMMNGIDTSTRSKSLETGVKELQDEIH